MSEARSSRAQLLARITVGQCNNGPSHGLDQVFRQFPQRLLDLGANLNPAGQGAVRFFPRNQLFGVAEHLRSPEEMAAYLDACIEEADGDAAFIAKALGDIARAQGMSQIARQAGLSRESLYKALSGDRALTFDTILKVISALGLRIHTEVVDDTAVDREEAVAEQVDR